MRGDIGLHSRSFRLHGGDPVLHQIADRDDSDKPPAINNRQVSHAPVCHAAKAFINCFIWRGGDDVSAHHGADAVAQTIRATPCNFPDQIPLGKHTGNRAVLGDNHQCADPLFIERARGLFVAEGRLVVPRLLRVSHSPGHRFQGTAQSVLVTPAAWALVEPAVRGYPDAPVYVVPQDVMNALVGFDIHRGCLAVARRPAERTLPLARFEEISNKFAEPMSDEAMEKLLAEQARVQDQIDAVTLEEVSNPDNVGGIFRSAAALGADLVILGPRCADPLYRKAVRTSMGTVLELPWVSAGAWPAALDRLRAAGVEIIALTPAADAPRLRDLPKVGGPWALVAGSEGDGLSTEALARADRRVTIPMTALVDSLNVATAVSIALHHLCGE